MEMRHSRAGRHDQQAWPQAASTKTHSRCQERHTQAWRRWAVFWLLPGWTGLGDWTVRTGESQGPLWRQNWEGLNQMSKEVPGRGPRFLLFVSPTGLLTSAPREGQPTARKAGKAPSRPGSPSVRLKEELLWVAWTPSQLGPHVDPLVIKDSQTSCSDSGRWAAFCLVRLPCLQPQLPLWN